MTYLLRVGSGVNHKLIEVKAISERQAVRIARAWGWRGAIVQREKRDSNERKG